MIITSAELAAHLRLPGSHRTALFLGAGASKVFGYPTTGELLGPIFQGGRALVADIPDDPPGTAAGKAKLLKGYLAQLLPGTNRDPEKLPLVTSLLSLLDYSLATGQSVMPRRSVDEIRDARQLLERAILELLADDVEFTTEQETRLDHFCRFMTDLHPATNTSPIVVITTNYDMAADFASYQCAEVVKDSDGWWDEGQIAKRVDYGFDWYHPEAKEETLLRQPQDPVVNLLKLHGSTNWLRCPLCEHIYINPWGPIWQQAYRVGQTTMNLCHCTPTRLQAQIVSPSFVRDLRQPNLLAVWKAALDGLRSSDRWVIIGYSLPDEDLGVRALFTRAYGSRGDAVPEIHVIQHDNKAHERYEAFFDPRMLKYATGGLDGFLQNWVHV